MLAATLLALGAAVIHAAWNLAVKEVDGDRFVALWGQFALAGVVGGTIVAVVGMPATGWIWAAVSGLIHVPYVWYLARAYEHGDFSVVYPIARGGGAALAAVGGVVLLGDDLRPLAVVAILVITAGLVALAGRTAGRPLLHAVLVAATVAVYSTSDAHGIRSTGTTAYAFATFAGTALATTLFGIATGHGAAMARSMRIGWRRHAVAAAGVVSAYTMVQVAFDRAPVGYVTALRESSVVLAALAGWWYLGEVGGQRRLMCAGVVAAGLLLLVVAG